MTRISRDAFRRQPTKLLLAINLKAARALLRADEVIQ
jgi:hypothetical protein